MNLTDLDLAECRFRTSEEVFEDLRGICEANPDLASFEVIGRSEEGRPIAGVTLGVGPRTATLVAGAHADEPVGPETLRTLILEGLGARDWLAEGEGLHDLFEQVTFRIVPHINPDAEARNQPWIEVWPDLGAYLRHRVREQPGRDVEFGYPVMRPENAAASRFLFGYEPIDLHMSFHSMGVSEGALLLVERRWIDRSAGRQVAESFLEAAATRGMRPHDHDRGGDKGFVYGGPGVWSTPEGCAMREHFLEADDMETASKFFLSSMETAVLTGRDPETGETPLCLVTEVPLFHLAAEYDHESGVPGLLTRYKERLPRLQSLAREGGDLTEEVAEFDLHPVKLETAVGLQLEALEAGLRAIGASGQR